MRPAVRCAMLCCLSLFLTAELATSQNLSLTAPASSGGTYARYFDLQASEDITICSFDVGTLNAGFAQPVDVYACGIGSYQGQVSNPGAWAQVASVPNFYGQNALGDLLVPLRLSLSIPIAAGTRQGFFISSSSGIRLGAQAPVGTPAASNADLAAISGPEGSIFLIPG